MDRREGYLPSDRDATGCGTVACYQGLHESCDGRHVRTMTDRPGCCLGREPVHCCPDFASHMACPLLLPGCSATSSGSDCTLGCYFFDHEAGIRSFAASSNTCRRHLWHSCCRRTCDLLASDHSHRALAAGPPDVADNPGVDDDDSCCTDCFGISESIELTFYRTHEDTNHVKPPSLRP